MFLWKGENPVAKRVMMLIDNLFEDSEALYPYYRMKEAGCDVTVVAAKKGTYHGKYGYPLEAERTPAEVDIKDFSAVIIPGGIAPDRIRIKPGMVDIVRKAVEKGLVVAAICHGPQVLIEAGVLRGRRATSYISVKTDLVNAGARYEDSPVVVDGNIVTSRHPGDLPDFCRAVIEKLS